MVAQSWCGMSHFSLLLAHRSLLLSRLNSLHWLQRNDPEDQKRFEKINFANYVTMSTILTLHSSFYVDAHFCQIKRFPTLAPTLNIYLVSVLKWKLMHFKSVNFVFLKNKLIYTMLWYFVLLITYNMSTQKYYFC